MEREAYSEIKIEEALEVIKLLGLPIAQHNERSALVLLALLDLKIDQKWEQLSTPLMGVTPIMDWIAVHYNKKYAPNTRETIRRQSLHQFLDAGLVLYNPDKPDRPVNSPKAVYQVTPAIANLLRNYGTLDWLVHLREYLDSQQTLIDRYAKERESRLIPVRISEYQSLQLSPGPHSELIKQIIEEFAPVFAPNSQLVYAGDTGSKFGYFDEELLKELGVEINQHGKMPDVILYYSDRNWLLLVESVTSHGPVDGKRHDELAKLFSDSKAGLVYVTAFPDRALMRQYLPDIAWETEVWVADAPTHLIHFNGVRFLGPYES